MSGTRRGGGSGRRAIPERRFARHESKARVLQAGDLARITDPHIALSLRFRAAFGLRREESLKIRPNIADQGSVLVLQASWTKGGRPREIPIRTDEQIGLLAEAKALLGSRSLIPAELTYVQQLRRFEHHCAKAGIHRVHGHRHQYAQTRYRELTGWAALAAGGPTSKELSSEQKAIDHEARIRISRELGHEREWVVAIYCGWCGERSSSIISRPEGRRPDCHARSRRMNRRRASAIANSRSGLQATYAPRVAPNRTSWKRPDDALAASEL